MLAAISSGVNSTEYFAFASGFDGSRYIGLKFNQHVDTIEKTGYLVKKEVASKQLEADSARREDSTPTGVDNTGPGFKDGQKPGAALPPPPSETPKSTRFFMTAQPDIIRIGTDLKKLMEEVINHLAKV